MICLTAEECRLWRRTNGASRREWKRQLTVVTPRDGAWFADALVRHLEPFDHALLIVDQVVFSVPAELEALRRRAGEARSVREAPGHLFERDVQGFRRVLELAYVAGFDFGVVFAPSRHALRADHDGYTTFFSASSGRIAQLKETLREGQVKLVPDWTAEAP